MAKPSPWTQSGDPDYEEQAAAQRFPPALWGSGLDCLSPSLGIKGVLIRVSVAKLLLIFKRYFKIGRIGPEKYEQAIFCL
jgi:hypothetical protein